MSPEIAVDSNVLIALIDERDKFHFQANALYTVLRQAGYKAWFFDVVFNETVSVVARRHEEQKRTRPLQVLFERLERQVPKHSITWVARNTESLFDQVMALVHSSSGDLNFHDALIALACRERGIPAIASFDADFDSIAWLTRIASVADLPQR